MVKIMNAKLNKNLIEKLSDKEHDSWARWMKHLFNMSIKNPDGSVTIPKPFVDRWTRQMNTEYKDLSENEKESDRREIYEFISILKHEKIL